MRKNIHGKFVHAPDSLAYHAKVLAWTFIFFLHSLFLPLSYAQMLSPNGSASSSSKEVWEDIDLEAGMGGPCSLIAVMGQVERNARARQCLDLINSNLTQEEREKINTEFSQLLYQQVEDPSLEIWTWENLQKLLMKAELKASDFFSLNSSNSSSSLKILGEQRDQLQEEIDHFNFDPQRYAVLAPYLYEEARPNFIELRGNRNYYLRWALMILGISGLAFGISLGIMSGAQDCSEVDCTGEYIPVSNEDDKCAYRSHPDQFIDKKDLSEVKDCQNEQFNNSLIVGASVLGASVLLFTASKAKNIIKHYSKKALNPFKNIVYSMKKGKACLRKWSDHRHKEKLLSKRKVMDLKLQEKLKEVFQNLPEEMKKAIIKNLLKKVQGHEI